MTFVRTTAPGKVFLLGEYAVLEGAPALLMAVDRRVSVTAASTPATGGAAHATTWRVTAPQLGLRSLALEPDGTLPATLDPAVRGRLALVASVLASFSHASPLDLEIDSAAFEIDGHKLGLGSSAAVAVALTAALAAATGGDTSPTAIFALADAAHRRAQGGTGSGGDVAASTFGGHLRYVRGASPTPAPWPALAVLAVETGTGSSTVELVVRVAAYRERDPHGAARDLAALADLAHRAADGSPTALELLALADDYFHALDALDTHAGAGIITPRHRELREVAAACGAVFKSSGAGGGDLGLVFAKLEATGALESAFAEAGAAVIPVPFSPDGVRIEVAA